MDSNVAYVDEIDGVGMDQLGEPWTVRDIKFSDVDVSDSQLVPDDIIRTLISIRDQVTQSCFTIGDIANNMVVRAAQIGFDHVTAWRVRRAVGRFCGKSERTVRYYAEVAAFYPENVRTIYEVLPFSHFVFAKTMGGQWQEVLDYALGKPEATVDELKYQFVTRPELSASPSPAATDEREADKICDLSHIGATAEDCAPDDLFREHSQDILEGGDFTSLSLPANMVAMSSVSDMVGAMRRLSGALEEVELPRELFERFFEVSASMRGLLAEITQKLAE